MSYTKDVLLQTLEAVKVHGSKAAAARALGVDESSVRRRVAAAAREGLVTEFSHLVPVGFDLKNYTAHYKADGTLEQVWIKPTLSKYEEMKIDAIKEALSEIPQSRVVKPPKIVNEDLATFYIVSDHHLGLYAWAKETGNDYDVEIGKKILKDTMAKLVAATPESETAVVLNLGDFFHSDSNENRTRRSGNVLDVDTRFQYVLKAGVYLFVDIIEMAKRKHKKVIVRCNFGNHDPYGTLALSMALKAYYSNDPRVEVDDSPNKLWFWEFGKVMVFSTHGDMFKQQDVPGVMAAHAPEMWGRTTHRYGYLGHVHHKSVGGGEKYGATWETFRTLAAKDEWHHSSGYASERSMVAITHHREHGEKVRHTEPA